MTQFGWLSVVRLGLVQACLGAVVVLATSTINRVMVVELSLPALVPGFLVALHYLVQVARPRMVTDRMSGDIAPPGSSGAWPCSRRAERSPRWGLRWRRPTVHWVFAWPLQDLP